MHQTHPPSSPSSHPHSSYKPYQEQPSSPFRHASYSDHSPRYNAQGSAITPSSNMIDFTKYLARREIITTGLTKFDDQPESFRAWQSSFFNATQDLDLSASEELDLLVKRLGRESSEHVIRAGRFGQKIKSRFFSNEWTNYDLNLKLFFCFSLNKLKRPRQNLNTYFLY